MQIPRNVAIGAAIGTVGTLAVAATEAGSSRPHARGGRDGLADGAVYGALLGSFVFGWGAIPGAAVGVLLDAAVSDRNPEVLDRYF